MNLVSSIRLHWHEAVHPGALLVGFILGDVVCFPLRCQHAALSITLLDLTVNWDVNRFGLSDTWIENETTLPHELNFCSVLNARQLLFATVEPTADPKQR